MILYSNNCPKCMILKKKLEQKDILYDTSDDFDILLKNNFQTLPVLGVDGKLLPFTEAVEYINTL